MCEYLCLNIFVLELKGFMHLNAYEYRIYFSLRYIITNYYVSISSWFSSVSPAFNFLSLIFIDLGDISHVKQKNCHADINPFLPYKGLI